MSLSNAEKQANWRAKKTAEGFKLVHIWVKARNVEAVKQYAARLDKRPRP